MAASRDSWAMTDHGCPHITIHEDMSMYDHRLQQPISPYTDRRVKVYDYASNQSKVYVLDKIWRYYFLAPWNQDPLVPYVFLDTFGFNDYCVLRDGRVYSLKTYNYLVGAPSHDGYPRVLLKSNRGRFETHPTHRIVAAAFIPNPENKPEVNHIDGNKENPNAENLEWVWSWENMEHALKNNLRKSALDDDTIHQICQLLEEGHMVKDIMSKLNVAKHNVLGIKSGIHNRISCQYNIPRNKHF